MKTTTLLLAATALALTACHTNAVEQSTIDPQLDSLTHALLVDEVKAQAADSALLMIVNTATGEVKAMNGTFGEREAQEADFHKYEISSLERIATWLAAVDAGKVSLTDTVDVGDGRLDINEQHLKDHNWPSGGYGTLTYHDAFARHSNIATYKAAETAFADRSVKTLTDAYNKVGLKVALLTADTPDEFAWATLGQSAATTAWDFVEFFNAIAASGKLVELTTSTDTTASALVQISAEKNVQAVRSVLEDRENLLIKKLPTDISTGALAYVTPLPQPGDSTNYRAKIELCGYYPATQPQYTIYLCLYTHNPNLYSGTLAPLYSAILSALKK